MQTKSENPEEEKRVKGKQWAAILLVIAAAAVLCAVLLRPGTQSAEVKILVDGAPYVATAFSPEQQEDLRVILTLDGKETAVLPFGEAHTVRILQPDGAENTLKITGESVYMESANCEGQDCVHMEKVTRDNLETRVMFGMIICLPHRLSVEVR